MQREEISEGRYNFPEVLDAFMHLQYSDEILII
jgi:hypothetical protein